MTCEASSCSTIVTFLGITITVITMLKFQQSHNIPETLSESVDAVSAFDQDGDNCLDRKEFGDLLRKFSAACEVVLDMLIDFMVIQLALVDSDNNKRAYLASLLTKPSSVAQHNEKSKRAASHFYQQASMIFFMQKKSSEVCSLFAVVHYTPPG